MYTLEKWKAFGQTLWDKIKTIKMVTVPQFVSDATDNTTWRNCQIIRINGNKPRLSLQKLYTTRIKVGLSLPCIELYILLLSWLNWHWINEGNHQEWMGIKQEFTASFSTIKALLQNTKSQTEPGSKETHFYNTQRMSVWAKLDKLIKALA